MSYRSTYYYVHSSNPQLLPTKRKPYWLAGLLLTLGVAVIFWAGLPIIWYQLVQTPGVRSYLSPTNRDTQAILGSYNHIDYTQASNWFPTATKDISNLDIQTHYTISIPQLGIKDAWVGIGQQDLSKNLIHYSGTALPGQLGNSVIFGHSVLPQFFNPKNYMTIFSTLYTLQKNDIIMVNYDGVTYYYQIYDKYEVHPDEVSVLDQDMSNRHLTLVTCTPPGTYIRRLVIKSKLIPFGEQN